MDIPAQRWRLLHSPGGLSVREGGGPVTGGDGVGMCPTQSPQAPVSQVCLRDGGVGF